MDTANNDLKALQQIMINIMVEIDRICRENNIKYWLDSGTLLGCIRHDGFIPWDDDLDICMPREDYDKFIAIAKSELSKDLFLQSFESDKHSQNTWVKVRDRNSILVSNKYEKGHTGVFIDIFPMDFYEVGGKKERYKKLINNLFVSYWLKKAPFTKPFSKNLAKNMYKLFCKIIFSILFFVDYSTLIKLSSKLEKRINGKEEKKDYMGYGVEVPFYIKHKEDTVFPLQQRKFEGINFYIPKDYHSYLQTLYGSYMELPPEDKRTPSHAIVLKTNLTEQEYKELNENYL
ncbi:LicD family protein [Clostridium sp.]|uniref:LicD family protein n=1 Tax=Clostridium sp. TaxID=1506 RepID=UPI002FC65F87